MFPDSCCCILLLHLVVRSGSEETAALLLARGVSGSAADLEGVTALHLAASDGSKEFINLLIDNGAETAAKDNLGRTPLHCCAELDYHLSIWFPSLIILTVEEAPYVALRHSQIFCIRNRITRYYSIVHHQHFHDSLDSKVAEMLPIMYDAPNQCSSEAGKASL